MKKIAFCLLLFVIFLTACSSNSSNSANKLEDNNNSNQVSATNSEDNSQEKKSSSNDIKNEDKTKSTVKDNSSSENNGTKNSKDNVKDKVTSENNIAEKVKNYIINGQENKSEAQKIKWSETFLNKVDIEGLYKKYTANGGKADDLESFAIYITQNAPIPNDWQDLFKKDLYDTYGEKVARLEPLKDDLYQAYVVKNGTEVPYVVVSSRTGYFHG